MKKTSILLMAGIALAGAAAYLTARRRKSMLQTAVPEPVKKSRHFNPVFSHLKQDIQHS